MPFLLGLLVYIGKQRQTRKDGFPSREEKTAKHGGRPHSFVPLLERNLQDASISTVFDLDCEEGT